MALFRRQHHRRWIALVAMFGLLYQQLAMAAYLCPLESAKPATSAYEAGVDVVPPCHLDRTPDAARCHQHCHPTTPSAGHVSVLDVPALLPAVPAAPSRSAGTLVGGAALARTLAAQTHPPPLTVQHCTFQI